MAWIEAHQGLASHKKTIKLRKLLGIKKTEAIGTLFLLWWWAMDNAPDGDLSELDARDIAEIIEFKGKDPQTALDALIESGFIDSNKHIHDWDEYIGKLIEKRKTDAERKRTVRGRIINNEGNSSGHPGNVQRTSDGHPTDIQRTSDGSPTTCPMDVAGNRTVPNRTVPISTSTSVSIDIHGDEKTGENGGSGEKELKEISDFYTKSTGKMLSSMMVADIQGFLKAGSAVDLIEYAIGVSLNKNNTPSYFRGVMQNKIARGIKTYQQVLDDETAGRGSPPKVNNQPDLTDPNRYVGLSMDKT